MTDKIFEYDADVPTEDGDDTETFTFHMKDAKNIPVGIMRRNRRNELGLTFAALEWALPADEMDAFDRLNADAMMAMFTAWQEADLDEKPAARTKGKTKAAAVESDNEG